MQARSIEDILAKNALQCNSIDVGTSSVTKNTNFLPEHEIPIQTKFTKNMGQGILNMREKVERKDAILAKKTEMGSYGQTTNSN